MNYENRFILYLDILGFKKIISSTYSAESDIEENIALLYLAFETIRINCVVPANGTLSYLRRAIQFSDCIVVSFKDDQRLEFYELLTDVQDTLISLLNYKIICRGALTYGKVFHDDHYVFGPALVNAYELESQIAKFPRVIVDKSALSQFKGSNNSNLTDKILGSFLIEDFDNFIYVNYFSMRFLKPKDKIKMLLTLREIITKGISNSINNNIYDKYEWMRIKFNSSLEDMKANLECNSHSYKLLDQIELIK